MGSLPKHSAELIGKVTLFGFTFNNINDVLNHLLLIPVLRSNEIILSVKFLVSSWLEGVNLLAWVVQIPLLIYPNPCFSFTVKSNFVLVYMSWPRPEKKVLVTSQGLSKHI